MGRRAHATIALALAVSTIVLAGCGGNDGSAPSAPAARGVSGPQISARGRTEGSAATENKAAGRKRAGNSRQGDERLSDSKSGTRESGAGPDSSAAPTAGKREQKPPHKLTPAELEQVGPGLAKQARFLCRESTLDGLARYYRIRSRDPDDVAKAFAAPYLAGVREEVAAGCKVGLLESR
jgi:hypothetical protein